MDEVGGPAHPAQAAYSEVLDAQLAQGPGQDVQVNDVTITQAYQSKDADP